MCERFHEGCAQRHPSYNMLTKYLIYGRVKAWLSRMRLEWTVYAFTASIFFTVGAIYFLFKPGPMVSAALFALLTVLYGWVAWVMIRRRAVLELHSYGPCSVCSVLTPQQGQHCMHCGAAARSQSA